MSTGPHIKRRSRVKSVRKLVELENSLRQESDRFLQEQEEKQREVPVTTPDACTDQEVPN